MVVKKQGNSYANDDKADTKIAPLSEFIELQDIEFEIDRVITPTPTQGEPTTTPNGSVPNGSVPNHDHGHSNGHLPKPPDMYEADDVPTEVSVLIKAPESDNKSNTGPVDKWKIVYYIFALHGLGTLLPWNMFITAEAYYTEHKFGNVSDNAEYKDKFISYLGIAAFVPTLCFMTATLFLQHRTMTKSRIGYSILVMIALFVLTVILAILDTSSWPGLFYGLTMGTVVLFNGASAVYQSSLFGFAGRLPVKYTQGVLAGQGLGGTFVSLVSILSITVASSLRAAAIGYFSCALVVLIICYISFLIMNKMPYVKFYLHETHKTEEPETKQIEEKKESSAPTPNATPPFLKIFWKIKWQLFNIWMCFFVTLSIFPPLLVQVEPSGELTEFKIKYFTPMTCFLLFNLCDFVGSIFPIWIQWPSSKYLWIATTSRIIFFPIFLFCNYRPYDRTLPVLIDNDIVYVILVMVFALSAGYLKSLPMMAAPKLVEPQHSATAGAMMALFLVLGIFTGLNFSLVFPAIVSI